MLRISSIETILLLLLAFYLTSCGKKQFEVPNEIVSDDKFVVQTLDLKSFNKSIQNSKIKQLDKVIAMLAPQEELASDNYHYIVTKYHPTEHEAVVIVTETGLSDHSISEQKIRVKLIKSKDYWLVREVATSFRCQANRGHADWSGGLCQ